MKPNEQDPQYNNYQPNIITPKLYNNESVDNLNQTTQPITQVTSQPNALIDSVEKMPNPLNSNKTELSNQQSNPSTFKQQQNTTTKEETPILFSVKQQPEVINVPEIDLEEKITNKALLFSFILPPFGLYFGIKARQKSKSLGNINSNAILAIILSITFSILWIVLVYVLFGSGNSSFDVCNDLGEGTHKVKNVTYVCQ